MRSHTTTPILALALLIAGPASYVNAADRFSADKDMVLIPGGEFTMGSYEHGDEKKHQVVLDPFWIDKFEASNGRYKDFVKSSSHPAPAYWDNPKLNQPNQPVVGVSWHDANAFCKWEGKRLPTEAEWEKAARGEGKRRYPWGEKFEYQFANVDGEEDGFQYLAPVGSFEVGRSPFGLYDATGNVAEWVMDSYAADYYQQAPYRDPPGPKTEDENKVIRGGSWRESRIGARVTKRFAAKMWRNDASVGFRCAKDPPTEIPQSS